MFYQTLRYIYTQFLRQFKAMIFSTHHDLDIYKKKKQNMAAFN